MATNKEEAVNDSLEIRLGHEIPIEDYGILAASLNDAWDWVFEATPRIIGQRFESGHPFLVAYGPKKPDETFDGVDLSVYANGRQMPLVFLETIALRTDGDYRLVPRDYFSLTANGLWAPPPEDADTIIMVDLTSNPARKRATAEVSELVGYAKELFSGNTHDHEFPFDMEQIAYVWTYSPDRKGVQRIHSNNGATATNYRILDARVPLDQIQSVDGIRTVVSGFEHPLKDVKMMSYKG